MSRSRRVGTLSVVALLAGCGINVQDGAGPRVPIPNVTGSVQRSGSPAGGMKVGLRTAAGQEVASTVTTPSGRFGFEVADGAWELKVSSERPGDFESITRSFHYLGAADETVAPLDVFAYGGQALAPVAGYVGSVPSSGQRLNFEWSLPSLAGVKARVQCFDAAGRSVWNSSWLAAEQVAWDGTANQGDSTGHAVTTGGYSWRVKFSLPDSSEGRTPPRTLTLQ